VAKNNAPASRTLFCWLACSGPYVHMICTGRQKVI
jgi:hypothetical protein